MGGLQEIYGGGRIWFTPEERQSLASRVVSQGISQEQVDAVLTEFLIALADQVAERQTVQSLDYLDYKKRKKAEKAQKKYLKHTQKKGYAALQSSQLAYPALQSNPASSSVASTVESWLVNQGSHLALHETWAGKGQNKHGNSFLRKWMHKLYPQGIDDWITPLMSIPEKELEAAFGHYYTPHFNTFTPEDFASVLAYLKGQQDVPMPDSSRSLLNNFQKALSVLSSESQDLFRQGMMAGMALKVPPEQREPVLSQTLSVNHAMPREGRGCPAGAGSIPGVFSQ